MRRKMIYFSSAIILKFDFDELLTESDLQRPGIFELIFDSSFDSSYKLVLLGLAGTFVQKTRLGALR